MAIYDNNGTTNAEIGKVYDNNGTTNSQIGKVYDNNGTTNSLIYNAELLLYDNGNLHTANSGDWKYNESEYQYQNNGGGSKQNTYLYLEIYANNYENTVVSWFTGNKIDLTSYSKLCVRVEVNQSASVNAFTIGAASAYGDGIWNSSYTKSTSIPSATTYNDTLKLDISSLSGTHYIGLRVHRFSAWGVTSHKAKIYKVWLE